MNNKYYRNCGTKHIVITPFTAEESTLIKKATAKLGLRRPFFYHDAIVESARTILRESGDGADNDGAGR